MKLSTRTQLFSALVISVAWGCSSEPTDNTTGTTGGSSSGGQASGNAGTNPGGGAGNGMAGSTANAGSSNPMGGSAGTSVGGAAGGSAPVAGSGGAAAGAGGAAAGAGGAAAGAGGQMGGDCATTLPGVVGHPDCAFDYPEVEGFTLNMVEEFAAPIDLVADPIWTYSDGGLDEGIVRFVPQNITFEAGSENNGVMVLNFTAEPQAGGFSHAEEKDVGTKTHSSGEFRTKYNNYRYGRYEVNYKSPSVTTANPDMAGGYVATMFIFRTPKTTNWRELDIEQIGNSPTDVFTNHVYGNNQGGWSDGIDDGVNATVGSSARTAFHTYAFEWIDSSVTWYVDGTQVRQTTGGALPIPEMSAKIMMNLWAGAFGGSTANNEYPLRTEYNWFRFYKWDQEDTYPVADPATMLPMSDLDGSKNNPEDGVADIPVGSAD